ncbi:hypothetical protein Taro_006162 [Colocasia esculenta]|uniref:Peroxiredoxin-2F, mitochondrial n=1 Tax=Colocasia esculenta TaxID=4460 RepID=A0A843U005_COLES|nr:hypothetical protein [Colocasia esculenta]
MALAAATLRRTAARALRGGAPRVDGAVGAGAWWSAARGFASTVLSVGSDIVEAAPGVSLQKARTWDEGVSSKFSTTPLRDIFKDKKVVIFGLPGAFTGVCSMQHVPSYKKNIGKFKAKGIDSVLCVAVNDPYVLNGWAEKLQAKDEIEFFGDFDGSFHKSLDLGLDLSAALLGHRSHRWSAYVVDGKVKALNIEKVPSEFKVSVCHFCGRWSAYVVDGKVKDPNVEKVPSEFKVSGADIRPVWACYLNRPIDPVCAGVGCFIWRLGSLIAWLDFCSVKTRSALSTRTEELLAVLSLVSRSLSGTAPLRHRRPRLRPSPLRRSPPISFMVSVGFRARVDLSGMPEKFSGQHFKRWQQRMKVWFTMVGLISLIESDPPVLDEKVPDSAKKVEEWKEKDSSSTFKTTKALWDEGPQV